MQINHLDIAVIVVYMLAVLGVGLYQALKNRTTGDYYAGGRKFNKFYLMMHALGTASHADEPVSVIGGVFAKGFSGIWYTYTYLPLTPLFWLITPYVRRGRFVTMADFFHARYDGSIAVLYSVIGVLKMSVLIATVLIATAKVFNSVTGGTIDQRWAIYGMTLVFVTYGFAGGIRATVVTESIQGPLIVVMSLLMVPFGLARVGGFKGLHASLGPSMFSLAGQGYEFTPRWIIAFSLTALIGWVAQPGIVASVGSGKTELEGRVGYTYGTMIKRFCAMGWLLTGIILAAMVTQGSIGAGRVAGLEKDRELAFGTAMQALLPHGLLGLMFAAIFASQMATLSAQMVNSSALASRNIYRDLFHPTASDKKVLAVGRVFGLFLVLIGVWLAQTLTGVANALTTLLQFSSIMGVVVWGGVLWRRAQRQRCIMGCRCRSSSLAAPGRSSALAGMIAHKTWTSLPHWVGMYGTEQYVFELMLCYLPAGVLTFVIVSLLTPPPPRKQVDDFFMLINTPVGQEQKLIDAGVPMTYVGNAIASPLEAKHPQLVHWGGFALAAVICVGILGLLLLLARIGA